MRLIDADVLWEWLDNEPWFDNADRDEIAFPIVNAIPTVDAEVVVRCKDCKYSTLPSMQTQIYGKLGTLTCHNRKSSCNRRNVASDDYCSYADRKDDNAT